LSFSLLQNLILMLSSHSRTLVKVFSLSYTDWRVHWNSWQLCCWSNFLLWYQNVHHQMPATWPCS